MTRIVAHSGCEGTAPGSREGIETAVLLGADIVEVDLRLRNGAVWLSHDPLDPGRPDAYLALPDALQLLRGSGTGINCDLKEAEVFRYALRDLREAGMEDRAIFTGEYDAGMESGPAQYRFFQNVEKLCGRSLEEDLLWEDAEYLVKYYRQNSEKALGGFNVSYKMLSPEILRFFTREGIPLACWTVDDQNIMSDLLREGVAYITTNLVKYAVQRRAAL